MVLAVFVVLNTCVQVLYVVSVVWSEFMAVFMGVNLWVSSGFIFDSCSQFLISQ